MAGLTPLAVTSYGVAARRADFAIAKSGLKGKKVLITSGPTWVAIDSVRVISNTATGETGIELAKKFIQQGCRVTLLLGPVNIASLDNKIKVKRFSFFKELNTLLKSELKKDFDIVIQSAAISDFAPKLSDNKKISSGCKKLKLILKPTVKIINCLRKLKPNAFLVGFKFEPHFKARKLIKKTRNLIKSANLDLAVGNNLLDKQYSAYLVNKTDAYGPFLSKPAMVNNLIKLIERKYV
ncbi:MAG: phosphopantothenoylcysteine decarboxylase [Candidatus Omnitrophica bacterium]|nr:phosphopantothenoylcysteine decarboxylase [Candidatus Omnitrophota bacterium]